jgi:UDP-N-acetyl-D-mannosaminuronic acid dehydrogenase
MVNGRNIAVFGLGFVGLPLSLSFAMRDCNVIGIDVSSELVNEINNGITHHTERFDNLTIQEILKQQLERGKFKAVSDAKAIPEGFDSFIVTVGIPVFGGKHDYSYLENCALSLGRIIKKGDLIIIRSTVVPGTTEDFILPILEKTSGLKAGNDFYLAYSSERIAEGRAFEEFAYMPTVVGAVNNESLKRAVQVLSIVCRVEIVEASNIKVVETAKVMENVQRDVNIAMVQEFARFSEKLGIDIYEVIRVANTHKRVNLLTPGPGVGGYCIPNAYYYLEPKASELGVSLDLLRLSRIKNESIPEVIVNMLSDKLARNKKALKGSKIAVLGIAMKDYSNDDRVSPPISIINMLLKEGADVWAFDPVVPASYPYKYDSIEEVLDGADALLILARQLVTDRLTAGYIKEYIKKDAVIFDTRNMFSKDKSQFNEENIIYFSL